MPYRQLLNNLTPNSMDSLGNGWGSVGNVLQPSPLGSWGDFSPSGAAMKLGGAGAGGGVMDGLGDLFSSKGFGAGVGLLKGGFDAFMGMKQYGLAKDILATNKEQFAKNYGAQKTTTNAALEDRQRGRVASNAGAYQSVGDYMNQNRIN